MESTLAGALILFAFGLIGLIMISNRKQKDLLILVGILIVFLSSIILFIIFGIEIGEKRRDIAIQNGAPYAYELQTNEDGSTDWRYKGEE